MSAPVEVKGTSEDCAGSYIPCAEDQYRPGHASSTRWDISKKMAAHDRSLSKLREYDTGPRANERAVSWKVHSGCSDVGCPHKLGSNAHAH